MSSSRLFLFRRFWSSRTLMNFWIRARCKKQLLHSENITWVSQTVSTLLPPAMLWLVCLALSSDFYTIGGKGGRPYDAVFSGWQSLAGKRHQNMQIIHSYIIHTFSSVRGTITISNEYLIPSSYNEEAELLQLMNCVAVHLQNTYFGSMKWWISQNFTHSARFRRQRIIINYDVTQLNPLSSWLTTLEK